MNAYPLYIFFGVIPSTIWLLFFLREDAHPESNRMILKVFGYGIIAAFLAVLFEYMFLVFVPELSLPPMIFGLLNIFIGVALIEEILKYLVVKEGVLSDPELDEPLDVMLYMVIVGLGFAALENIFYLFSLGQPFIIINTLSLVLFRFLGATFLHALCSGTIGFFLALSFFETKHKFKLITVGILMAVLLHGLYNFYIMELSNAIEILAEAILMASIPEPQ